MTTYTTPANACQPLTTDSAAGDGRALPSFEDVRDMLDEARLEADQRYSGIPQLLEELQTQYLDGVDACEQQHRTPVELLKTRLRQERLVFDAYNKHRLGTAAWRFYKNRPAPENADELLAQLGDDIAEDLEAFPLRCEAVIADFDWLTEDLEPIYQSTEIHPSQPAQPNQTMTSAQTGKKSAAKTPSSTKPKTGRATDSYDKLADAPACNLDFPNGNMTLMELATFLPGSFKSWDLIDRACCNGASAASIATLINAGRTMVRGEIPNNSVYRLMKGPMDRRAKKEAAWKGWTVGTHDQYPRPASFDPTSVSVAGFCTAGAPDGKDTSSASPVLFRDLAHGVKRFPTGYDGLDLTRAVRYCVNHPGEDWYYPNDYERLVNQLPQDAHLAGHPHGPAPVQADHEDGAVMNRWVTSRTLAGVRNAQGRKHDSRGRLMKKDSGEEDFDENEFYSSEDIFGTDDEVDLETKASKRKRNIFDDSDSDEFETPFLKPAKRTKIATKPRALRKPSGKAPARPSHLRKELFADELNSDDSDSFTSLEKKHKKVPSAVRRSERRTKVASTYNVEEALAAIDEDEEELAAPKTKKADSTANYGMDAEMSHEDDEEDEDEDDEEFEDDK